MEITIFIIKFILEVTIFTCGFMYIRKAGRDIVDRDKVIDFHVFWAIGTFIISPKISESIIELLLK